MVFVFQLWHIGRLLILETEIANTVPSRQIMFLAVDNVDFSEDTPKENMHSNGNFPEALFREYDFQDRHRRTIQNEDNQETTLKNH